MKREIKNTPNKNHQNLAIHQILVPSKFPAIQYMIYKYMYN